MSKVVVFGIDQWAELAHFYLTHDSPHEVTASTVDREYLAGPPVPADVRSDQLRSLSHTSRG
jgi:hypothetical protein